MKIFYDHKIFYLQKFGGISKYFINICDKIKSNHDIKIIAPIHTNYYLDNFDKKRKFSFLKLKKHYLYTRKISNNINNFLFNSYCTFDKPDIVHLTYYDKNIYFKKNYKIVVTVYDLIHEIFENKYNFNYPKKFKAKYLEIADIIICISNNTKNDLINIYGINEKKIVVTSLGVNKTKEYCEVKNENLYKPYLLYVGDRINYKNFKNFILSYSKSEKLKKDFTIICFGGEPFTLDEKKFINNLGIQKSNIKFITGNDMELNYVYKKARAYICPSLYEGFGLTILEAMNMDCPVICSNTSSLPEVGGDCVEYFNPENIDEIKSTIENLVYSDDKILGMKIKSKERLKKFSWERCAKETEKVYLDL